MSGCQPDSASGLPARTKVFGYESIPWQAGSLPAESAKLADIRLRGTRQTSDQFGCMISRTKTFSCPSSCLRTSVISYGRVSSRLTTAPWAGGV